jgi:NAD(P) transhydrogenase subunit alpha
MTVTLGVLKETSPGENRVALIPEVATKLKAAGARVVVERGAGVTAQFPDEVFKDVEFVDSAQAVLSQADVLLTV